LKLEYEEKSELQSNQFVVMLLHINQDDSKFKKNQVSNHEIGITTCYRPTIGIIYQNNMMFEKRDNKVCDHYFTNH